jgi:hypothetical protein
MIIWGGGDGSSPFGTGGRYNPSTDSWTPTSTVNAPDDRDGHTAIWTGSEMIVWGGFKFYPIIYVNTGGRYNPSTDSWVATAATEALDGRWLHTAVWTHSRPNGSASNGRVEAAGGVVKERNRESESDPTRAARTFAFHV